MNTPRFYDNLLSLVEGLDLVGDTTFVRHCKTALTDLLHTPEALRASHAPHDIAWAALHVAAKVHGRDLPNKKKVVTEIKEGLLSTSTAKVGDHVNAFPNVAAPNAGAVWSLCSALAGLYEASTPSGNAQLAAQLRVPSVLALLTPS
jgi:hypothetical protein